MTPTEFATLIGATNLRAPEAYSPAAQAALRYMTHHYLYKLAGAKRRYAKDEPSRLAFQDAQICAAVLRTLFRPEVAAIVEEEVMRDRDA